MRGFGGVDLSFECRPIQDWFTLTRRPGSDLMTARSLREVLLGFGSCYASGRSFDADLRVELMPVQNCGDCRVLLDLSTFVALIVRIEDEATCVEATEKHHASGRPTVGSGGRHRHRRGAITGGIDRSCVPMSELQERVRVHQLFVRSLDGHRQTLDPTLSRQQRRVDRPERRRSVGGGGRGTVGARRYHPALMTTAPPGQPVLAQARALYRDAATSYRAHVGAVIGSAAIVLVPFALLDGAGLLTADSSDTHPVAAVILVMVAVGTSGLSGLASIFYAGYLDHTAAAWRQVGYNALAP